MSPHTRSSSAKPHPAGAADSGGQHAAAVFVVTRTVDFTALFNLADPAVQVQARAAEELRQQQSIRQGFQPRSKMPEILPPRLDEPFETIQLRQPDRGLARSLENAPLEGDERLHQALELVAPGRPLPAGVELQGHLADALGTQPWELRTNEE